MREGLLHFLWRRQAFDHSELKTTDGKRLRLILPGEYNLHSGPDFTSASLLLEGLEWKGSIEMHIRSSQWQTHGHHTDRAYNNVILHVVWENDKLTRREDGTIIPTLELKSRVREELLSRLSQMELSMERIPCDVFREEYSDASFRQALQQNFSARMRAKREQIFRLWHRNNFDWEQTAFVWLCRYLGMYVNREVFESFGHSLPYKILQKHRDRLFQLEALVFGMAGLLETGFERDVYWQRLRREFRFLKHKYRLRVRIKSHEWKFLRMRPANFPTVRLAQLAGILHDTPSLLNWMLYTFDKGQVFEVSDYWRHHYTFGKIAKSNSHRMGEGTRQSLWMNVVPPLQLALSRNNEDSDIEALYHSTPAENTRITRMWANMGVKMESALDSQSYYALYTQACKLRKCLNCPVGVDLLRSA